MEKQKEPECGVGSSWRDFRKKERKLRRELRKERKIRKSRSVEKVMNLSSNSLFPRRRLDAVAKGGTI